MRLCSKCGSQRGQASSLFGTNVLFCLVTYLWVSTQRKHSLGDRNDLSTYPDVGSEQNRILCQHTSEAHPSLLKERPTPGQWSRESRWKQDLRQICHMCSQHKTWHSSAWVFLWICSPTEAGSSSAQLSLGLIAEAPLNHQSWDIFPAVSGQMEVLSPTASPVLYCVFLRSVHLLLPHFLALQNGATDVYLFLMRFWGFEMTSTL